MSCAWENAEGFCTNKGLPSKKFMLTGGCTCVDDYDECTEFEPIDYGCDDCGADFSAGEQCGCHAHYCPDCLNHEDDCEC